MNINDVFVHTIFILPCAFRATNLRSFRASPEPTRNIHEITFSAKFGSPVQTSEPVVLPLFPLQVVLPVRLKTNKMGDKP